MAEQATPLDRLVDLALYAPVGLALELRKQLPGWAKTGRAEVDNRVNLYRMIGKFAVHQGRAELVKRLEKLAEERAAAQAGVIDAASERVATEPPATTLSSDDAQTRRSKPATKQQQQPSTPRKSAPSNKVDASDAALSAPAPGNQIVLPIADYDSLAASQVVTRLAALSPAELTAVYDYETAHRGRRTVLGKVAQLQAG
jgi:hypothetical protein